MEELYQAIEERIRNSGYSGNISGFEIYQELSDEIEGKENGTYVFMVKKEKDIVYEYQVDVFDAEFNLSYLDIHTPDNVYHIDFDADQTES